MASTYSTNLAFELPATGDQPNLWGQTNNTNIGTLIEQAISGYTTQVITDGADTTIVMTNGGSSTARYMYIECTGALTADRNLVVPVNKKLYFIYNNTTGGRTVTVKVSGQTGIAVPAASKMLLVSDGIDVRAAINSVSAVATAGVFTTLSASSTVSGAGFTALFASPPAIGGTAAAAGTFTTLTASSTVSGAGFTALLASPPAIGGTAAAAGTFTTLTANTTLTGAGVTSLFASPPAIGGTAAAAGTFTALTANTSVTTPSVVVNGSGIPVNGAYLPSANTLGFSSNTVSRGTVNSTGNWNLVSPSSGIALTVNGVSGTHSVQIADSANAKFNAGFLETPQNNQTIAYPLVLADSGKQIYYTGATGVAITIPANGSVAFPIGTVITIINDASAAVSITIPITTDTLVWANAGTTGTRTLARFGLATISKVTSTRWIISGTGLT